MVAGGASPRLEGGAEKSPGRGDRFLFAANFLSPFQGLFRCEPDSGLTPGATILRPSGPHNAAACIGGEF
jgi:hypothetical protein